MQRSVRRLQIDTGQDNASLSTSQPNLPMDLHIMIIDAVASEARRYPRGIRLHYYDCHYYDLDL